MDFTVYNRCCYDYQIPAWVLGSDIASIVDSYCAPLSLINALSVTIALKKSNEVKKVFQNLEDIWDEYGVYEKVDEHKSEPNV